jgi:CHAT domain-containing protein
MKFYCFLFVFFVCIGNDFGQKITSDDLDNLIQNEKFDALKTEFQKTNNSENSYVSYLRNKASFFFQNKNNLLAIKIMEHCCSLANNQYDDCDTSNLNNLHLLGRYYLYEKNSSQALDINLFCLSKRLLCKNIDPIDIARSYNNIANIYGKDNQLDSSLVNFKKAFYFLKTGNYKKSIYTPIIFSGCLWYLTKLGRTREALKLMKEWGHLCLNRESKSNLIYHINTSIYHLLLEKDFKVAEQFYVFNKKLVSNEYGKHSNELIKFQHDYAYELSKNEFYDIAYKEVLKILKTHHKHMDKFNQLRLRNSISVSLMDMKKDKDALEGFLEIRPKLIAEYPDSTLTAIAISNLALCYYKLGDKQKRDSFNEEYYHIIDKNKYKSNFQLNFIDKIESDLKTYFIEENYNFYEDKLIKLIAFHEKTNNVAEKLYAKLRLSCFYLFQEMNVQQSEILLMEVQKEIPLSNNILKSKAHFYYYFGEFQRKNGSDLQYDYYKSAFLLFDSLRIYPIEYENSGMHYAEFLLDKGDFKIGNELLKKILGSYDSTNIYSMPIYYEKKAWYLFYIKDFQSDEKNNQEAISLIKQIEIKLGGNNSVFRKAVGLLEGNIIDTLKRKELIIKWISSESKSNLNYFYAKSTLADFYFDVGNLKQCDNLWDEINAGSSILNEGEKVMITNNYCSYLIYKKKDYNNALKVLQKNKVSINEYDDNENGYYFKCYIGSGDFKNALTYLSNKENYILKIYAENSIQYFKLIDDYITYYERTEDYNLEKFYRQKKLDFYYRYQPSNKKSIISATYNLVNLQNETNLFEANLLLIKKAREHFTINIESASNIEEYFLLTYEVLCEFGLHLLSENAADFEKLKAKSLIIKNKIIAFKNSGLLYENHFLTEVLLLLCDYIIYPPIEDSQDNIMAKNMLTLFQSQPGLGVISKSDFFFKIKSLLADGSIEKAKQMAISSNNLPLLEEIEWEYGSIDSSFKYRFQIEQNDLEKIKRRSKSMTDLDLEQSRQKQKNSLNFALKRFLLDDNKPTKKIITNCFELIINNYGLISNLNAQFYEYLRLSDKTTKNQYQKLSKNNQENMIQGKQNVFNDNEIKDLEYAFNMKLINREMKSSKWITFQDVASSLEDSSAFVLNYKFIYNGFEGSDLNIPKQEVYYLTFIIHAKSDDILFLIDSINIQNQNDLVDYYHNEVTKKSQKTNFSFIYDRVWSNIDGQIDPSIKRIYYNPDGIYSAINVSTLYDKKTKLYLLEKYEIIMPKNLLDNLNTIPISDIDSITSAVLVGFPNYSNISSPSNSQIQDSTIINLIDYYTNNTRGVTAKNLPGTKIEVEQINKFLIQKEIETDVLIGNDASEQNIKNINSPKILHIATHGFFMENIKGENSLPMLNSGLLLSGSNNKSKGGEDGYLSAFETSLLNLENTKLVVLSACETGRGVIKDGDGVFGLKQGCLNAGAKNIIMSLWKVDDKVTQEFMSRFYEIWLNDKTSIREAFNKTQLEIKAKYPEPYYWGAFILVGE